MITGMALHLKDIIEMEDNLHIASAGIMPEINTGIWKSDQENAEMEILKTEVLKKYFENFERMSLLVKSYADFLTEDTDRIYQASVSLLEFDGRMIS
ncbi:MAG: hypothetical protein K2K54_05545 [Lachnospiraceae bacterium]|nr:hypothetical protein [Lachnospiraceae bacterium]